MTIKFPEDEIHKVNNQGIEDENYIKDTDKSIALENIINSRS